MAAIKIQFWLSDICVGILQTAWFEFGILIRLTTPGVKKSKKAEVPL